jgi:hypothetical protein
MLTVRRDTIACVADSKSYALLDVDRLLKIPLSAISSLDNSEPGTVGGRAEDISSHPLNRAQRSTSSVSPSQAQGDDRGHGRSTSLGTFMSGASRRQDGAGSRDLGRETPDQLFRTSSPASGRSPGRQEQRESSPGKASLTDKPLPAPPAESGKDKRASMIPTAFLKPHIASPSPQEFLFVTGTGPFDPGVGIIVNWEGDVTRGGLEFERYPEALVVDGRGSGTDITPNNAEDEEEGYVLAIIGRGFGKDQEYGLEIQRWDIDHGEDRLEKFWLELPANDTASEKPRVGIRTVVDPGELSFDEVVQKLCVKHFKPFARLSSLGSALSIQSPDPRTAASLERVSKEKELFESQDLQSETPLSEGWEEDRNREELQYAKRLARAQSRIVVWSGKNIWWAVRNPLALRMDANLDIEVDISDEAHMYSQVANITQVINSLRGREAKTEIEFMSLAYIRQRAGLMLFINLVRSTSVPTDTEYRNAEEALLEGGLDPRVVLALNQELRDEIIEGKNGIWIPGGVKRVAEEFILDRDSAAGDDGNSWMMQDHALQFYRRFLLAWRRKKGFGSIANENDLFRSVDAALLVVLLRLDRSKKGFGKAGSVRAEVYELVDSGVECFDRAIAILESYHRLYVLSRLYQSRKSASDVLATWKRIIEGERDDGGEFTEGEQRVREYLKNIRNESLVQEYGIWLAGRNSKLGVQVFADDGSKVKFQPEQVVEILRSGAPNAVKDYLEYLVFGKHLTEYVNELIAYYLDNVIHELTTSSDARTALSLTYFSYRALRPPKPTYRQFITDNAISAPWWQSRLRLLQLLGGTDVAVSYDVPTILARIEPFADHLVPELIILDGKQARHEEALSLLTHGLGDYDTAISYCLLGGSSLYHPVSGAMARDPAAAPSREEQARLFRWLLREFLRIEDVSDRVEQTSNLLERFGGWFEVDDVMEMIPDDWSVNLVAGFLVSALRGIVSEKRETMVVKALSGAENLKVAEEMADRVDELGPEVEVGE